jgi:dephospho-CoA kinase
VILVGLTGGIGSGKSTVSARLTEHGAVIIDADAITREVQAPGSPVLAAIAERFGPHMVGPDGELDRAALAAVVFPDPPALKDLNAIVHPAVGAEIVRRVHEHAGTDDVVVLDVPLLVEGGRRKFYGVSAVIVVDTPVELAVARLIEHRGFSEADARARVAAQATREDRLARADLVIENAGSIEDLLAQVDRAWHVVRSLPPSEPPPPPTTS